MTAKIYLRQNGSFGSSCDRCQDTGHHITEDSGKFTVYSADNVELIIALDVSREEAEKAIETDWRSAS